MNAVEIEEAVSELASQPFDRDEFPFQFLTAFGNKDTTVRRLRAGSSNTSDVPGGVLQRSNIHIATAAAGQVRDTLSALRESPRTSIAKAKFILATDGETVEAEDMTSGEPLVCDYRALHEHFGFFLPLAGISTITEIKNNPIDIKATGRLNKLYVELLKDNPEWGTREKRPALNQFMARLIFCFFAEDTGIFLGDGLFTATIARMSTPGHGSGNDRWGDTHEVLAELFRAMATDTRHKGQLDDRHRKAAHIKSWADVFPYVNGGLFSGSVECPRFTRIARSYLLRAGELSWNEINPDIFGSMIQAVADDDERGELGMHYTSVPNILKVLNPLFLDDLREQLEAAGDNARKLRNLRKRIASIRVFDPACGSGNFLVIAYLKMREIEHEIVQRTGDDPRSSITLTNFYGIEIKSFAVEIARLSLLIAEFQADCRHISQHEARAMILPLHRTGQIHVGNALRMDWLAICPLGSGRDVIEHDLGGPTGRLALAVESAADAQTFICGNPPYKGSKWLDAAQKEDLRMAWSEFPHLAKITDYVTGWLAKAEQYLTRDDNAAAAFVMTNSIVQGQQAGDVWATLFETGLKISFAHLPFKWQNLAANNAGVTVVVVGITKGPIRECRLFDETQVRRASTIGCFLIADQTASVSAQKRPISQLPEMVFGNMPRDGGHLILTKEEAASLPPGAHHFVRRYVGAQELIDGSLRYCLWIGDEEADEAAAIPEIYSRLELVASERSSSKADSTRAFANQPYRFVQRAGCARRDTLAIPSVSSENREWLPCDLLSSDAVISNRNFGLFDAPLWNFALVVSRVHWVWISTVCGRLEMRFMYSNTVGWNTFPVPLLTEQNKADLAECATNILLAREAHFPATIADLYDPEEMPDDLRRAHEYNDETIERIYIGRRFRNDTERLEKLFELYTKMAPKQSPKNGKRAA